MSNSILCYSLLYFSVVAEGNQQCVSSINIQSKKDKHCFQTMFLLLLFFRLLLDVMLLYWITILSYPSFFVPRGT